MMILASGNSPRIAISASRPFISGICKSIRVMSGRCARNCWIASCPFEASATKHMSGWVASRAAIPLRNRGWSSTVRIRIESRPSLIVSSNFLSRRDMLAGRPRVGDSCGNGQLYLGSGVQLAPDSQFTPHQLGTFVHPWQAVMSGASALFQDLSIDPLSIVPHSQPKLPLVVVNVHFDSFGRGVPKGITQCLPGDPIDFVPEDRSEPPGCAFFVYAKIGRWPLAISRGKSLAERADRAGKVFGSHRGGAQSLHRIAALRDRLPCLFNRRLQQPARV